MCLDQQRELGHLNSSGNSSTSYGTTRAGTPNCTGVVKRSSTPRSPDALRKLLLKPSNVSPDYQSGTNSNSNLNRKIKSAGKLSGGSPKATATSGLRKHKQNFKSESGDCWNRNRTISCGEVVQRNEYDLLPSSPMSVAAGHEYDMQLSRKAGVMADVRVKMEPDRMASPTLYRSSSGYALVEPPPEDQFYGMELRRATDCRFYDRPIQLPVVAIQLPVAATQFPHRRTPITCDDGSQPDCREDTSSDFGSGSCVTVDIASPSQPLDYRNESSVSPTPSTSGECRNWRLVQPTPVQVQNFQTQQKLLDAKPEKDEDIVCTENNSPSRTAAAVAGGGTEDPDRNGSKSDSKRRQIFQYG